jgi:hypothetical protein
VLVFPRPLSQPCIPFPSAGPNVAFPALFAPSVLFRAVRFDFFAEAFAPPRTPAFWSRLLAVLATAFLPPLRSDPPRAFCRLVPPPRLFPLVPPREFDPTLLLGVALGIPGDRVRRGDRVQNCATLAAMLP